MPSILIVDDDAQIRDLLFQVFEDAGYEVAEASDGKQAMEQYRQSPADLVILDILMPEKEGLETIIEFRREFPTIKIVAISGGNERAHVNLLDLAKRLGAVHAVHKPLEIHSLVKLAASVVKEG